MVAKLSYIAKSVLLLAVASLLLIAAEAKAKKCGGGIHINGISYFCHNGAFRTSNSTVAVTCKDGKGPFTDKKCTMPAKTVEKAAADLETTVALNPVTCGGMVVTKAGSDWKTTYYCHAGAFITPSSPPALDTTCKDGLGPFSDSTCQYPYCSGMTVSDKNNIRRTYYCHSGAFNKTHSPPTCMDGKGPFSDPYCFYLSPQYK